MLTSLLEHMPPQMHLILLTRTDPAVPLSRLRARGQLIDMKNFFLVPLDSERRWYCYHPLFADVPGKHLERRSSAEMAEPHRRAARWYEQSWHSSWNWAWKAYEATLRASTTASAEKARPGKRVRRGGAPDERSAPSAGPNPWGHSPIVKKEKEHAKRNRNPKNCR
jgi:hypothetical protein